MWSEGNASGKEEGCQIIYGTIFSGRKMRKVLILIMFIKDMLHMDFKLRHI